MQFTPIVEGLLFEHESDSLDFKQAQYRFTSASDEDKAELLKDVLAFANAWRRSDAYIVIGSREVKGQPAEVLGITEHLDDAHLQQFVNSKTHTPVQFSYATVPVAGKSVGLLHIPVQVRPLFLKQDFGRLKANTVYVRRGSATEIASPHEVANMGADRVKVAAALSPMLEVYLVRDNDNELQQHVSCELISFLTPEPDEIPDYGKVDDLVFAGQRYPGLTGVNFLSNDNPEYYRERAKYLQARGQVERLRFAVVNKGNAVARDVQLVLAVRDDETTIVHTQGALPSTPTTSKLPVMHLFHETPREPDVSIQRTRDGWQVKAFLGKLQPKQEVITIDAMYIGTAIPKQLSLEARVFSDDLPEPIAQVFNLAFEIEKRVLRASDLKGVRSA